MHFETVPPYLLNLSTVELALISRITVCLNVHILRYGMLTAKGHSISIPQRMTIAKKLPLLPENIGIGILRCKGKNDVMKHYAVKRKNVERALNGLCYGFPNGGFEDRLPGTKVYTGPNHHNKNLHGRYFYHFPNQYYNDVEIKHDRLERLPLECTECPHLKVIDMDNVIQEEEKGPAPQQFDVPFSFCDETMTSSGITLPMEPKMPILSFNPYSEN